MINFHKKTGKPASVQKGHEDVWFSTTGLYVSDNTGAPRLITAATTKGSSVPVGVPPEPNMLYFNQSTRKHYISTDQKWVEIPTAGIPGSGTGGGNASNVMIDDAGNWYTSNDVEGALAEIGERIPHLLGTGLLPNYGTNTLDIKTASEYLLNTTATNKPSTVTSWLTSRKSSTGDIYGFAVDKNGNLFSRVNNTFAQMAKKSELDATNTNLANLTNNLAASWKVKDIVNGNFTSVTSTGGVYTIGLNTEAQELMNALKNNPYVKKSGDSMTGPLRMEAGAGVNSFIQLSSTNSVNNFSLMDDTKGGTIAIDEDASGFTTNGPRIAFKDNKTGKDVLSYYPNGALDLKADNRMWLRSTGYSRIETTNPNFSVDIFSKSTNVLFLKGPYGSLHIGTGALGYNFINSFSGRGSGTRSFFIGTADYRPIPEFWVRANDVKLTGRVYTSSSVNIGFDPKTNLGTADDNCIRMYTNRGGVSDGNSNRIFAALYWDYKSRNFVFNAMNNSSGVQGPIYVEANGFRSRSSIKYKNVIGEFEAKALDKIMGAKVYNYTLKGDTSNDKKIGLIIEKGAPKEVVDGNTVDNYSMIAMMWKGIQELTEEVNTLKAKMESL